MKQYDVYGIGHALVDTEIEVSDRFVRELHIDKGSMSLVSRARQDEVVHRLYGVHHRRTCGGSAANTVIGLAQFGGRAGFACKVADDADGRLFLDEMRTNGVITTPETASVKGAGPTGRCLVLITPDAERSMLTDLGVSESVSPAEVVEDAVKDATYVYVEGYLVTSPSGLAASREVLRMARAHGAKLALTFSDAGIVTHFREQFDQLLGEGVDLLFCNEREALAFTGCGQIHEASERLLTRAGQVAVTLGGRGALLREGRREIEVIAAPVDAVDTTGAGDLFAGGLLYGLTHGMTLGEAGRLACAAASELVTQYGARLDSEQSRVILQRLQA